MTNPTLYIQLKEKQQKLALLQSQLRTILSDIRNIEKIISNGIIKKCECCSIEFTTTNNKKIYCTLDCNRKVQQKRSNTK